MAGIGTRYTNLGEQVDNQIDRHMNLIVESMNDAIVQPAALILGGGFARGEGTAKVIDGVVHPINDYDITIVTEEPLSFSKNTLNTLALELSKKITNTSFSFTESTNVFHFYLDFRCMTTKELMRLPPLLKYYELKHSGKVIYGDQSILDLIPNYQIKDMPREDGFRFLFNRMSLLVEFFRTKYLRKDMSIQEKESLLYFISKMNMSIAEALTLLSNTFEPSYVQRANILEKSYATHYPELSSIAPNVPDIVTWATDCKLHFEDYVAATSAEEVVDLWFKTRENLRHVIPYYTSKLYGIDNQIDWIRDSDHFMGLLRGKLDVRYTRDAIKAKLKLPLTTSIAKYASYGAQVYLNSLYYRKLKELKGISYRKILHEITDPGLKIFRALPQILYALKEDGSHDRAMISRGVDRLQKLQPSPQGLGLDDWDSASVFYADVFRIYQFMM
ncbi:MAG: hypothetical protein SVY53_06755 [Chloroflexota bacterium]|nr:hypothetical protein [Chloroflexota bacterium]